MKNKQKQKIVWRRAKVEELSSLGYSEREIASKLQVSDTTVHKDLVASREQAEEDIRNHFKSLPLEVKKCEIGANLTIKMFTEMLESATVSDSDKIDILNSRLQAYHFKAELLDGKIRLDDVYALMDKAAVLEGEVKMQNQPQGLIDQKGKVVTDGTLPTNT